MASKVLVASYPAFGGPEFAFLASDGHEAGPTDEGEYRVAYCGRHSSRRYPTWSKIPWGSKLKEEGGIIMVHFEGRWRQLSDVVKLTKAEIEEYHYQLYRTRVVPSTWVFNDFGHATCFLYKDRNRDGRRNANEPVHGEFLHTTPPNEAQTALHQPVVLEESHGCIHLTTGRHRRHGPARLLAQECGSRGPPLRRQAGRDTARQRTRTIRSPLLPWNEADPYLGDTGLLMMPRSTVLLVGLSTLSIVACRDLSAAAPKAHGQDATGGRPPSEAGAMSAKGQVVRSALAAFEGHLNVKDAMASLEGRFVEVGPDGWWKGTLKSGETAVLGARGKDREVQELEIYFQLSDRLFLRDLLPILGAYTKVFESKTAGVRFDHAPARGVIAFADLFSSKALPDSEVVKVSLRRSTAADLGR